MARWRAMTDGLRPQVRRPKTTFRRRRATIACAIGIAIALHASIIAVLLLRPTTTYVIEHEARIEDRGVVVAPVVIVPSPPIVIAAPSPPVAIARPSCPPSRVDAPWVRPSIDEAIQAVRPAPSNAGWIAAWNDEHVFVSTDAGATFERVLDGDGKVADVSFDCFGHVLALRGKKLGIRDGGRERWRVVDGIRGEPDDSGGILGGGPDIVVIGTPNSQGWLARMATSSDLGESWSFRDLEGSFDSGMTLRGRQDADATIHVALAIGDCRDDVLVWATIRDGHATIVRDAMGEGASFGIYGDLVVSDGQWRTRDQRGWHDLDIGQNSVVTVVPGAFPVIVSGEQAFRVAGGKLRPLALVVDGQPQAVDLAGRVWSVACGLALVAQRTSSHLCTIPE